jgi:hypothetical protein
MFFFINHKNIFIMERKIYLSKNIKLGGLPSKKIYPFLLPIFILLFVLPTWSQVTIWPEEISFNYETGTSNDAISIQKNAETAITAPEYKKTPFKNDNCAYVMGQSNRKIKVKFSSNTVNMNFLVKATVVSGTGIGQVSEGFVAACDLNTNAVTLYLSGTIPASVGKRTFTWKWEATALPINSPYCPITCESVNTEHTFYTLLAIPQAPLVTPWTDVLDYACAWADGQSTASGTMQKVVEGLYNRPEFKYHINGGASRYTGSTTKNFNLTLMLSDFGSSDINVNCYDMGKSVNLYSNALGCNSDYVYTNPFGYLNCIKPIGRSWTNNPFYVFLSSPYNVPIVGEDLSDPNRTSFGNHAFCMLGNIIYDACLTVDVDSNPDYSPFVESWATSWDWSTYRTKIIDNIPASSTGSPVKYTYSVY